MKRLFDSVPPLGTNIGITYARDLACQDHTAAHAQELGR
jgi:hypothetical protein